MFKLSTTDFRFRVALIVAAGLMSVSGFNNRGETLGVREKSTLASETPIATTQPRTTEKSSHLPEARPATNAPKNELPR